MTPPLQPRTLKPLAAALLAALLAACGGGGGDDSEAINLDAVCPLPAPSRISVMTEGGQPVLNTEDYVRAHVVLSGAANADHDLEFDARIRGRGNSTWHMDKKPYKLKLDDKTALFGMYEGKDWAVLANHADKTLLRNEVAFCTARVLGLPDTPASHFFELSFNGRFDGLYQITPKTYPVSDRIKAQAKELGPPQAGDEAFVVEIDFARREPDNFVSAGASGIGVGIGFNVRSDTDAEETARIKAWIDQFEALIADRSAPDRYARVAERVDLQSMADQYLVHELLANPDGYQSSTYLYRLRGGPLVFGPVWDFDQALGITADNIDPEGWLILHRPYNWYLREMLAEPAFAALVRERWQHLARHVPALQRFIDGAAGALDEAQGRNFERWPILDVQVFSNVIALGSYDAEVAHMRNWLAERARWMDAHIDELLAAGR